MFGKSKDSGIAPVPVYTVHTLDRPYELLGTVVVTGNAFSELLTQLSAEGARTGADAVIAVVPVYTHKGMKNVLMGTAVKFSATTPH